MPPESDGFHRTQILLHAFPMLVQAMGRTMVFPLRVLVLDTKDVGFTLTYSIEEILEAGLLAARGHVNGQVPAAPAPVSMPDPAPRLTRTQRRLIEVATDKPTPVKALIARAGYKIHADSRAAVTFLCREDYLKRTPDGIVRGPRPL